MRRTLFSLLICSVMLSVSWGVALADDKHLDGEVINFGMDYVVMDHCTGEPPMQLISDPSYRLVIYLNFEGADLTLGGSNSKTSSTNLIITSTLKYPSQSWSSMGGKEKGQKDVITELRLLYGNYAVEFVTTRPTSGDYTMVMSGGTGENCKKGGPGTVGIAPLDCKNSNKNDIVLVFGNKLSSVKKLAFVIAHELGHSFGLEHVSDNTDIMSPTLTASTCCWTTSSVSGSNCGRSTQDAKKVLSDNLGVGAGDTVVPRVWFVRPGDGAVLPSRFTFEVKAADDLKVHHVDIYLDDKKELTINSPPFTAFVSGLSDGSHKLRAEVFDYKPNKAKAEVKVTVRADCVDDGNCGTGKAGTGLDCAQGGDCISGICAKKDSVAVCVETCDSKTKLCPTGTKCLDTDGQWACTTGAGFKLDTKDSSGCNLGAGETAGGLWLLSLLGLLALRRRRRK